VVQTGEASVAKASPVFPGFFSPENNPFKETMRDAVLTDHQALIIEPLMDCKGLHVLQGPPGEIQPGKGFLFRYKF
jgi:hypothetical protein